MMDTDRLLQLIDAKHTVLAQLHDLAQRQFALAGAGDTTALVSLLAVKQRLLDTLSALEERLDPYRSQDPQDRTWRTSTDRAHCAEVAERSRTLLDEIMSLDQRGMELLQARQQQTLRMIHAAHDAAHARTAYFEHQLGPAASQHFDMA